MFYIFLLSLLLNSEMQIFIIAPKFLFNNSVAFLNWTSRPIINNVSSESTKIAPIPPKLLTQFIDCDCERNNRLIR